MSIVLWVLQIAAALAFFGAGSSKLRGVEPMVHMFAVIGIGQWFRYVTGCIEVGSAVMLLVPRLAVFGATLLACTMVGAILAHLFVLHSPPTGPVVLLCVVSTIAWLRRGEIQKLLAIA